MKSDLRRMARRRLDDRLQAFSEVEQLQPPQVGWIRALRDALGMTTVQLARRMGVSSQAVTGLEQSEANGTIGVNSLRKAAEALDATLVYALVPNRPLEDMVKVQARRIAMEVIRRVDQTMKLEGQQTGRADLEEALQDYMTQLRDRELWDE